MPAHILLVEDEAAIAETIRYALKSEGIESTHVLLGQEALQRLQRDPFNAAILDVGLPDCNGFDLYRDLRRFSDVPVIFLTARADEIDRVVGLELGAEDYVTKPFSPRELLARVRNLLRREAGRQGTPNPDSRGPSFVVEEREHRIFCNGVALALTRYEYLLLKTFLAHPERIFSREELMRRIWVAPDHSLERTVDAHVKTLRAKLRLHLRDQDPIETHRGLGYAWKRLA